MWYLTCVQLGVVSLDRELALEKYVMSDYITQSRNAHNLNCRLLDAAKTSIEPENQTAN